MDRTTVAQMHSNLVVKQQNMMPARRYRRVVAGLVTLLPSPYQAKVRTSGPGVCLGA